MSFQSLILDGLDTLTGANLPLMLAELKAGTFDSEATLLEQATAIAAKYIPGAASVEQAVVVAKAVIDMARALGVRPVQPGDPSYYMPNRGDGVGS